MEKTKSPLTTVSKYSCVKEYTRPSSPKGKIKIWFNFSGDPAVILNHIETALEEIKRHVAKDFKEIKTENT